MAFGVQNVVSEGEKVLFREFPVSIQGVYYVVSIVCLGPNDCTPKAKRLYGQGQNELHFQNKVQEDSRKIAG